MKMYHVVSTVSLSCIIMSNVFGQAWKEKIGLTKTGKEYAKDLTEEETMELLGGYKPDDGIVNEFHQAHLNQVVFTGKEMAPETITNNDLKTVFGISEPIYFTFYMSKSFRNQVLYPLDKNGFNQTYYYDHSYRYFKKGPEFTGTTGYEGIPMINEYGTHLIYVEIDSVQITDVFFDVEVKFNSTKTAFTGFIFADPTKSNPNDQWVKHMNNLSAGDHKVRVEIAGYNKYSDANIHMTKDIVASGEFILRKGAGEKFAPKFGISWADYKSQMDDKALEEKLLKAVQEFGRLNKYTEKFLGVKIASKEWQITRSNTAHPVITGRGLVAYCYAVWSNGQCKVQRYHFWQQYDGTNYSSVTTCYGVYNNDYPKSIDCE